MSSSKVEDSSVDEENIAMKETVEENTRSSPEPERKSRLSVVVSIQGDGTEENEKSTEDTKRSETKVDDNKDARTFSEDVKVSEEDVKTADGDGDVKSAEEDANLWIEVHVVDVASGAKTTPWWIQSDEETDGPGKRQLMGDSDAVEFLSNDVKTCESSFTNLVRSVLRIRVGFDDGKRIGASKDIPLIDLVRRGGDIELTASIHPIETARDTKDEENTDNTDDGSASCETTSKGPELPHSISVKITLNEEGDSFARTGTICTWSAATLKGLKTPGEDQQTHALYVNAMTVESDGTEWCVASTGIRDEQGNVSWAGSSYFFVARCSLDALSEQSDEDMVRWPWRVVSVSSSTDTNESIAKEIVKGTIDILDIVEPGRVTTCCAGEGLQLQIDFERAPIASNRDDTKTRNVFLDKLPSISVNVESREIDASVLFEKEVRRAVHDILATCEDARAALRDDKEVATPQERATKLQNVVMYMLNTNGRFVAFRDRLKTATVALARRKCEERADSTTSREDLVRDSAFLTSMYEECTKRCRRVLQQMIVEVDREPTDGPTPTGVDAIPVDDDDAPVDRVMVRKRMLAQEAELNGDVRAAIAIQLDRVHRAEKERAYDAGAVNAKRNRYARALVECANAYFRTRSSREKVCELLKRACALQCENIGYVLALGCASMSEKHFDDAEACFRYAELLVESDTDGDMGICDVLAFSRILCRVRGQVDTAYAHPEWPSLARKGGRVRAAALLNAASFLLDRKLVVLAKVAVDLAQDVAFRGFDDLTRDLSSMLNMCEGRVHLQRGDTELALGSFREVLETTTDETEIGRVCLYLGHAHFCADEPDEALRWYECFVKRTTGRERATPRASFVAHDEEEREGSESGDALIVYVRMGKTYMSRGEYDAAKQVLLRACHRFSCATLWLDVARACVHTKSYEEAQQALAEANLLDNTNGHVWLYLALVFLRIGRKGCSDQAWLAYGEAVRLGGLNKYDDDESTVLEIATEIGTTLFRTYRQIDRSSSILSRVVDAQAGGPSGTQARLCLAEMLESQNLLADAKEAYSAISCDDDDDLSRDVKRRIDAISTALE